MAALSAAQLVALWDLSSAAPAHQRLEPLVAAAEPGAPLDEDSLGARNRRLLALHAGLAGAPPEARLRCARCRTDNLFTVPAEAIRACAAPDADARVTVGSGRRRRRFRLPNMADLKAAASLGPDHALEHIAGRCQVDGPAAPIGKRLLAHLAAKFEERDPAARIEIDLGCVECGAALRAAVDIAELVAAAVDRTVDRLFREVHAIARVYGWGEEAILALPDERRRRYLSLIAASAPEPRVRPALQERPA
jgi:hypothetical protein